MTARRREVWARRRFPTYSTVKHSAGEDGVAVFSVQTESVPGIGFERMKSMAIIALQLKGNTFVPIQAIR